MSNYQPDMWAIVQFKRPDQEPTFKVFGSWYGGYLGSDSWRLSSGVISIVNNKKYYEIHNESGSVYVCGYTNYGMSGYSSGVYFNIKSDLDSICELKMLSIEEVINLIETKVL